MHMTIKIIKAPDVFVTDADLARYADLYAKFMMYYAGPFISFEQYIRNTKKAMNNGN